jgi:hypothetical protein
MTVLLIALVIAVVAYVYERGRHERTRLESLEKDAMIYAFQRMVMYGDEVRLPNGDRGMVCASLPDTVLVETEQGDMYSVSRWVLKPVDQEC